MNSRHALDLAAQVADALAHAHRQWRHPQGPQPGHDRGDGQGQRQGARFRDVGLDPRRPDARALAAAAPHSVGADAAGILSYVSPEQARGVGVDPRSDLFSLGPIVYEMLTGTNPFAGPDASTTLTNIIQTTPPAPTSINPDLPKLLDVVLLRAVASDLTRRTESASKLAADLRRCAGLVDAVATERPSPRPDAPRATFGPHSPRRGERGDLVGLRRARGALAAALYFWLRYIGPLSIAKDSGLPTFRKDWQGCQPQQARRSWPRVA